MVGAVQEICNLAEAVLDPADYEACMDFHLDDMDGCGMSGWVIFAILVVVLIVLGSVVCCVLSQRKQAQQPVQHVVPQQQQMTMAPSVTIGVQPVHDVPLPQPQAQAPVFAQAAAPMQQPAALLHVPSPAPVPVPAPAPPPPVQEKAAAPSYVPPTGPPATGSSAAELETMTVGELRQKAAACGITNGAIEDARDSDDPRSELTALIIKKQAMDGAALETLKVKLSKMNVKDLRMRAAALGVNDDAIEEARDADDPQTELVALILAQPGLDPASFQVQGP
eukprot:COSAG06_NODE_4529_length_4153_cov_1.937193_7_plen_280_part_00